MTRQGITRAFIIVATGFVLALLACTVYWNQRSEYDFPPIGEFIDVQNNQLHVLDTGHDPDNESQQTLVLLHGASTSLLDYEPRFRPPLEQSHRVIAFDRPGHGYSSRPASPWTNPATQAHFIATALQQMGVEQSIWIGHSWSGSVVLAGMLNESTQVSAGVLLAGASHPWEGDNDWHVELGSVPLVGHAFAWQLVQPGGRLSLDAGVASVFNPDPVPDNYLNDTGVELTLRPWVFRNNAIDITQLSEFLNQQKAVYDEIEQPLLLLTGSEDTIVPSWNHSERLIKQVPQAIWIDIEGAGHALHHSRTDVVIDYINRFISDTVTAVK